MMTYDVQFDNKNLFDKDSFLSTTFKFQEFHARHLKLADDYAERKGYAQHLHRSKAHIKSATKCAEALYYPLEDNDDWEQVLNMVKYLYQTGKKALTVELEVKWSRFPPSDGYVSESHHSSNEEEELDESEEDLQLPSQP